MKAIKILLTLIIVGVIVIIGGVAAFVSFADPNDFKATIAEKVKENTGRTLSLDGDLEWAFWPKIRLKAGPMSLSNAEGFGDEPFFAADEFQVAVATLPLLGSRVEMDTVILHGVSVNLARNADGVSNWDDLAGGEASKEQEGGGLGAFVLGGVDIKDARFTYKDDTTGQDVVISKINVGTGALTLGEPVEFSLSLTAVANQPALDSDLSVNGTVEYNLDDEHYVIAPLTLRSDLRGAHLPGGKASIDFGANIDINLDAETASITGLKLSGLGTEMSGQFEASDIEEDKPSARGELSVDGADLARIFNAFELPVGKQLGNVSNRAFNFDLAFDANMDTGEVVVSKLDGNALGATLGGTFNATGANTDEPSAKGALSASGPDLPTLLAVLGQLQGADAETLASLNKALAGAKDKSFSIKADLDADLAAGNAALPVLEAKLLGNTITGSVNATDADSDKPKVSGALNAEGPDFPTLLTVVAQMQGADAATLKGLSAGLNNTRDRSFKVSADFNADMSEGVAAVPKLAAKILGNTISGEVNASKLDGDKPAAKGKLTAKGADLPAMLAIASQFQGDGAALRDMAKLLAKEKNKGFEMNVGFDTDLDEGRLALDTLNASLLGLQIDGQLSGNGVDFEKSKGSLDGKLSVTSQDLGVLLRSAGQADLAKSVRTVDINAGIQGSLSDLSITPLSIVTQIHSPEVKKPVDLKVSAEKARANLDNDTFELEGLTITGLGLNANLDLEANKISDSPSFKGRLSVPPFNLRKLLASLNQPVPKTKDPKALTKVSLASDIAGTAESIKLNGLQIGLDSSTLKGDINVASFTGPDLTFEIGIDQINVDNYLDPDPAPSKKATSKKTAKRKTSGKGAKAVATKKPANAGDDAIPVELLRALKVKGKLLIGDVVLSGAKMKNIRFAINAANGVVMVSEIGADMYGGGYNGAITLNAKNPKTVLSLDSNLSNVNIEPLIIDTVENNMLSGIVNFNAKLKGVGTNGDGIKKTLNGKGAFKTTNGVFRGVDAVAVLRAVEQIIECKCPVPVPTKGGETRFTSLSGNLIAKQGIIRNSDLLMQGDGFQITGKGTLANLHDNTTKYNLTLAVPEQAKQAGVSNYNLGGYAVPIKCRGSLESPSCLPDFGDILKQVVGDAAKKKVQEEIGDKLKNVIPGDAGEALKKIFKF